MAAARTKVSGRPPASRGADGGGSAPFPAARAPLGVPSGFGAHLERIRAAKERADALVDSELPLGAPEASLALLWEIVFDRLCAAGDADASEVGALAGIVQKLFSTDSKRPPGRAGGGENGGISERTLRKIEEKLRLL